MLAYMHFRAVYQRKGTERRAAKTRNWDEALFIPTDQPPATLKAAVTMTGAPHEVLKET